MTTKEKKEPKPKVRKIAPAGKKKQPEQLAFDDPQWKEFMQTELGKAADEFAKKSKEIEALEEERATVGDKVLIEMKKQGKTFLRPQIDGVFYDFEIKKTEAKEKLSFKRATA